MLRTRKILSSLGGAIIILTLAAAPAAAASVDTVTPTRAEADAEWRNAFQAWDYAMAQQQARPQTSAQAQQQQQQGNGCGPAGWKGKLLPDRYGGAANFRPSCDKHDICYSRTSRTARASCDTTFKNNLLAECKRAFPPITPELSDWYGGCLGAANTYYNGVRKYGKQYYLGSGNPN